jgi:hypothetical protein
LNTRATNFYRSLAEWLQRRSHDGPFIIGDASRSGIGTPNFEIVNEVLGEAAMNDATGFHDVTAIVN